MDWEVPGYVADVLDRLERRGYEAYVVGGCVRDLLLGRVPSDWDVTTSASPAQAMEALSGLRLIETGLAHGTVTALSQGRPVEVTAFRVDGPYSDGRHPDRVRFTRSLREDLARRDFTINAMAYHPRTGLIDPFGGREDLARRLVRCVGDPDQRFSEDALRLLRGLRFASVLGFSLEPGTAKSILRNRALLNRVAAERLSVELLKLICGDGAQEVLLDYHPVVTQLLPELAPSVGLAQDNPYHIYDVYEHSVRSLAAIRPVPHLRLAMLLHDAGKPARLTRDGDGRCHFYGHPRVSVQLARQAMLRLRLDHATMERVLTLIEFHDADLDATQRCVRRMLHRLGEEAFRELLLVKRADNLAHSGLAAEWLCTLDQIEPVLEEVLARRDCFSLKDLAINGRDLLDLGIPAGPRVGRVLQFLLEAVMDGSLVNEREPLLEAARRAQSDGP